MFESGHSYLKEHRMKKVFSGLAVLLLLAVIAQFYLAASGAFDTAPTEEAFQPHRVLGNAILVLAVVVTVVAAVARMRGRLIGLAGLVAGLVLVQSLIREVAKSFGDGSSTGHFVFGLHALNGLVIVGLIGLIVRQSRQISGRPAEVGRMAS
jgi:cytochrome b561